MPMREALLTPSLSSSSKPSTALYSVQSGFLVAFFGGGFAIILYAALNSIRLRRPLDALAYVAASALLCALFYAAAISWPPLVTLLDTLGQGSWRYVSRAASLLLFGAFYLLHRKEHRSAELFGLAPLSPWIPAIACMAVGYGLHSGLVHLLSKGAA